MAFNPTTASEDELESALKEGRHQEALDTYFGPELRAELAQLAEAAPRRDGAASRAPTPRVFILPGIMGSKLSVKTKKGDADLIWIDPLDLARDGIHELRYGQEPDPVVASGVLNSAYLRMKLRLRWEGFTVSYLPFDWRHGIDRTGEAVAAQIREAESPVALICHSMGGLVARKVATIVGKEIMPTVVTVGTPNLGSYSPVTVMRLTHSYVQLLGRLSGKGPKEVVEKYISRYPGLLELLPSAEMRPGEEYFKAAWWPAGGVVPESESLSAAGAAQANLPPPDARFHQIVGYGEETIVGARIVGDSVEFEMSRDGDGTVPRDLAEMGDEIASRYYYPGGHGWLCNRLNVIYGAADIIESGRTDRLSTEAPQARAARTVTEVALKTRGGEDLPRTRNELVKSFAEDMLMGDFASAAGADFSEGKAVEATAGAPAAKADGADERRSYSYIKSSEPRRRLNIDLLQGNILNAASEAYVIAAFQGISSLGGAAGAIDFMLDNALSDMLSDGQITGRLGEITFVPMPRYVMRTSHVVVVGLGPLGRPDRLRSAIRVAGRNLMRQLCVGGVTSIATVVWGAGSGLDGRETFGSLFDGMFESLHRWDKDRNFSRITVCESDAERHAELEEQLANLFARFNVADCEIVLNVAKLAPGRLDRATAGPRVPRIHRTDSLTVQGDLLEVDGQQVLQLEATFARGSTDSRYGAGDTAALPTSRVEIPLDALDQLVERLRRAVPGELADLAHDLWTMVFDKDMQEKLDLDPDGGLTVSNNPWGSRVPWELLHARGKPIALGGGVHRRYLAATAAVSRSGGGGGWRDTAERRVFMVSNPTLDLTGAKQEAIAIKDVIAEQEGRLRLVPPAGLKGVQATHDAVIERLTDEENSPDVFHYAGHAFFDPDDRARSGLILHNKEVLLGTDIATAASVPRFVFLNACESARVRRFDPDNLRAEDVSGMDFMDRSAGLAEAFLLGGVSHLIGTIWPVGDADAVIFAKAIYTALASHDIGRSVTEGRRRLADEQRAAWVNYMHYGDPTTEL